MSINPASESNKRNNIPENRSNWFELSISLISFMILVGLLLSLDPLQTYGKQMELQIGDLPRGLVHLQSDSPGQSKIVHRPRDDQGRLSDVDNSFSIGSYGIPGGCLPLGMYASPRGPWLAIQASCESRSFVQVVNASSGKILNVAEELNRDSIFLSWSLMGNEMIIKTDAVSSPRVYRFNVASGRADQLPVPATTYDVALSPDGKRMVYSLTQGLGYGSETWIADADGKNAEQVLVDSGYIIAFTRWSPSGEAISYIRIPDTNVPFTIGELWVMNGDGRDPVLLGEADAGHGYRPDWSPDGQKIAYVVREQDDEDSDPADREADYIAHRLISNIYLADLRDLNVTPVTRFSGALTETPVWSPDGEYIAFGTTAGGSGMDIWVFETRNNRLEQVTHGAKARYPAWLSVP